MDVFWPTGLSSPQLADFCLLCWWPSVRWSGAFLLFVCVCVCVCTCTCTCMCMCTSVSLCVYCMYALWYFVSFLFYIISIFALCCSHQTAMKLLVDSKRCSQAHRPTRLHPYLNRFKTLHTFQSPAAVNSVNISLLACCHLSADPREDSKQILVEFISWNGALFSYWADQGEWLHSYSFVLAEDTVADDCNLTELWVWFGVTSVQDLCLSFSRSCCWYKARIKKKDSVGQFYVDHCDVFSSVLLMRAMNLKQQTSDQTLNQVQLFRMTLDKINMNFIVIVQSTETMSCSAVGDK